MKHHYVWSAYGNKFRSMEEALAELFEGRTDGVCCVFKEGEADEVILAVHAGEGDPSRYDCDALARNGTRGLRRYDQFVPHEGQGYDGEALRALLEDLVSGGNMALIPKRWRFMGRVFKPGMRVNCFLLVALGAFCWVLVGLAAWAVHYLW